MHPPLHRLPLQLQAVLLFAAGFLEKKRGEGRERVLYERSSRCNVM
jgi:hypothetical protein